MNNDTAMHANDLTQLSSREQLSALMDGALPPDETRFLLRRLQHDAPLAECWERWRLTGEVMRGLAPAQRLPADFAKRVGMALHGPVSQPAPVPGVRMSPWLRWGAGAAMAASVAVAALVVRQPANDVRTPEPAAAMAATSTPIPAPVPVPQAPASPGMDAQALVAAGALAATARPERVSRRGQQGTPAVRPQAASRRTGIASNQPATAAESIPLMPQPGIVTRPWPRSVLPQYASAGLAVGFGSQGGATYNPFQAQAAPGVAPADAGNRDPEQAPPIGADGSPPQP